MRFELTWDCSQEILSLPRISNSATRAKIILRSEPELNRRTGFCRPLPNHSAIGPSRLPVKAKCQRVSCGVYPAPRVGRDHPAILYKKYHQKIQRSTTENSLPYMVVIKTKMIACFLEWYFFLQYYPEQTYPWLSQSPRALSESF